jgi:hypothetical protein
LIGIASDIGGEADAVDCVVLQHVGADLSTAGLAAGGGRSAQHKVMDTFLQKKVMRNMLGGMFVPALITVHAVGGEILLLLDASINLGVNLADPAATAYLMTPPVAKRVMEV